jgi:hypothetical protein
MEHRRYGDRSEAAQVQRTLFIVGAPSERDPHLLNLLVLDPQFAAPFFFQMFTHTAF